MPWLRLLLRIELILEIQRRGREGTVAGWEAVLAVWRGEAVGPSGRFRRRDGVRILEIVKAKGHTRAHALRGLDGASIIVFAAEERGETTPILTLHAHSHRGVGP